jgi:GNAT superfamily N-acetyltransferase
VIDMKPKATTSAPRAESASRPGAWLVRLACEQDREVLVGLCCDAVRESVREIEPDPAIVNETFDAYLRTAEPTFFVVEQLVAGRRVLQGFLMASIGGYAFASGIFTTQQVMYVRPEKRGSRAATLLIEHLIAWSKRLGALEITGGNNNGLYTEQTVKLLRKHGFEQVGVFMRRRGVD